MNMVKHIKVSVSKRSEGAYFHTAAGISIISCIIITPLGV